MTAGSASATTQGAGANSTSNSSSSTASGANDGQGSTLAGDLANSALSPSLSGSSTTAVSSHRLSGGLDFRGPGFGIMSSMSSGGILSHSNNHLFHATGHGNSAAAAAGSISGEVVQATPPLQRRLAKSFSVAQSSSSLQKGHYP